MNRMYKYALSAVLGLGLAGSASAQTFADVPENHWAYEAIRNLQGKILFGYKGTNLYRGNRPLSRYEFATAINNLYMMLMGQIQGVEDMVAALEKRLADHEKNMQMHGGSAGKNYDADIADLRKQIADLKNARPSGGGDMTQLRNLINEFEKDIASLGVDVDAMKKDIADLDSRVEALEKMTMPVKISGEISALVLTGPGSDSTPALVSNGRIAGVGRSGQGYGGSVPGLNRDSSVLHEAAFTFSGKADNVDWAATLVAGNTFGTLGYNGQQRGVSFTDSTTSLNGEPTTSFDLFFDSLWASFGSEAFGQGFKATVGRIPVAGNELMLKRTAYNSAYFDNERYNDGKFRIDGLVAEVGFGPATLTAGFGRLDSRSTNNGGDLNNIMPAGVAANQIMMYNLAIPLGENGQIQGAYHFHDLRRSATGFGVVNKADVFGADGYYKFGGNVKVGGAYASTVLKENNSTRNDSNNDAYNAYIKYMGGSFTVGVGYQAVSANHFAPGSWGKVGTEYSLRNTEGYHVMASFNAGQDLMISAKGGVYEGKDTAPGLLLNATNDEVTFFNVGLDYKLSDAWMAMLGFESAEFKLGGNGNPEQNWFSLGLRYGINQNAFWGLRLEVSDVDFKGQQGAFGFANNIYKGSLLSSQLSVKF
jgi:hypothetical protein